MLCPPAPCAWANVAKGFIDLVQAQTSSTKQDLGIDLRVAGLAVQEKNPLKELHIDGLSKEQIDEAFRNHTRTTPTKPGRIEVSDAILDQLVAGGTGIVVDCNPNENCEEFYTRCFRKGISVVASNSKSVYKLSEKCLSEGVRPETVTSPRSARLVTPGKSPAMGLTRRSFTLALVLALILTE